MYDVLEPTDCEPREYYRCPIEADQASATLKIGRKKVSASVLEKSIEGYSILIKKSHAKMLRTGRRFTMKFDGTAFEVQVKRIADADNCYSKVGVLITKDMTKPPKLKSSWWPSLRPSQKAGEGTAQIAFAGFVLVLFCAMAMPGLGDRLGTSDRIQGVFKWIINTADSEVTALSR